GGDEVVFLVVRSSAVVGLAELAEEGVGGSVAEGGGISLKGERLAVGVVQHGAEVSVHRLPVADVQGIVVGAADRLFNTEAAQDGSGRSGESGGAGPRARGAVRGGIDVDGFVFGGATSVVT